MGLKFLIVHVCRLNLVILARYDQLELFALVELVIISSFDIFEILALLGILVAHVLLEVIECDFKTLDILFA